MKNRWIALSIIFVSFLQFTLNWFNVVPCFGGIIQEMHIGLPAIGSIVGMFLLGYGIMHIPGGLISEQFGMRSAMLLGIGIETVGTAVTGLAPSLNMLLVGRVLCGVGGSIYLGSAIGITTAWFRGKELVTASGLITGVAFTLGAAIGIFPWHAVVTAFGWRDANLVGAAVGAATFFMVLLIFPVPPHTQEHIEEGHHLDGASLKRVFANRNLWLIGLSDLGAYGAYFTAVQLLPNFAQQHLGMGPGSAAAVGTIILISGIPGSFVGGWLADRVFGVVPTFLGACGIICLCLFAIPFVGPNGLYVLAALLGGVAILGFVGWISLPGLYAADLTLSDIPTAAGLMLSIAAIGGVLVPNLYGHIAAAYGYTAAWEALGVLAAVTACAGLFVKSPSVQQKVNASNKIIMDAKQ